MIGCLRTRVRKQPITALYFESENELKLYNLEAWFLLLTIIVFALYQLISLLLLFSRFIVWWIVIFWWCIGKSFMQTIYLCVLIHIWVGGGVGTVGPVWALRWSNLLTFPSGASFVDLFFLISVCCVFVRVCLCVLCGRLLGGGGWPLGSHLWICHFPLVSWVRCGTWLYRFLIFAPLLRFGFFLVGSFNP